MRIIQINIVTDNPDDDVRIIKALLDATGQGHLAPDPDNKSLLIPAEIGAIDPNAKRDKQTEAMVIGPLQEVLDEDRAEKIALRKLEEASRDYDKGRIARIVEQRASFRLLPKFVRDFGRKCTKSYHDVERESSDATPSWRFAIRVVIRILTKAPS